MKLMKITEVVARSIMGDGIITNRDERGLYVEYDRVVLNLRTQEASLWKGDTKISTLHLVTTLDDVITLSGIEGRQRIRIDGL